MQGAYLLRMLLSNAKIGVDFTTFYCLGDGPSLPPPGQTNSYGLLRTRDCPGPACTHEPKVSFQVAKVLATMLGGMGSLAPRHLKASAVAGVYTALAVALTSANTTWTHAPYMAMDRSQPETVLVIVWLRTDDETAAVRVEVEGVGASGTCFDVKNMTGHEMDVSPVCVDGYGRILVARASPQPLYLLNRNNVT